MKPVRVQLRRSKGWRMPPNTVSVARPGRWGNPFRIGDREPDGGKIYDNADAVAAFETWLEILRDPRCPRPNFLDEIPELRGKNLACWCKPEDPCHADVLLEIANAEPSE